MNPVEWMFCMCMSKLLLNDLPHAIFEEASYTRVELTGTEEGYATPGQLRYIAILSGRLDIPEPTVKRYGEAGRLIRHYETELEARKKMRGGSR